MSENQTPVVFTGNAGEYFGIWIVNLLLSIVTLGIYSAWAKVRRKKYFYNNTLIDGVGFDYHANPIAILKGRIIAFVLFVAYSVLSKSSPMLAGILMIAFFLAIPWIIVRGMTFNARNSSHRGLRFDFDGNYGQAAKVFIGYPLLVLLTLGLALPFVAQRTNKFVFDHHKFGLNHFQMNALVKDFYMIYLKLLGVVFAIGLLLAIAIPALTGGKKPAHVSLNQSQYTQTVAAPAQQDGFIKVANVVATTDASIPEDYLKDLSPKERDEFNAQMKAYEAQASETEAISGTNTTHNNPLEKMFGPYAAKLGAIFYVGIIIAALLYATVILSISAYMHSRTRNLIWNNAALDHVSFLSNQRMRDLVWIYLSNIVVLILTLGFATPWVQIRMARYRAEHLAILGETDWDKFVGEKKETSRAMGEEIADMFDVDISFG